tara:strand:- start:223 stop:918 length:696 start_codon:yes stop_codon:yes gene_type:complete
MSEETTQAVEPKVETAETQETTQTENKTFNQDQVNNIISQRLEAEKKKYESQLAEIKKKEEEALKEKELKEAKSKQEIEKLMQQRIAEKESEILKYKTEIKKERVDNSVLSVASKMNAVNPQQVVDLLKSEIKLNDDNRTEVLDKNSNIRYNERGELLTIEERVKEFLDANPHFSQGSKSGVGSQSSIEGKTVKPFNIQDLDMSKAEDRQKYAEYRKKRDSSPVQINLNNK